MYLATSYNWKSSGVNVNCFVRSRETNYFNSGKSTTMPTRNMDNTYQTRYGRTDQSSVVIGRWWHSPGSPFFSQAHQL